MLNPQDIEFIKRRALEIAADLDAKRGAFYAEYVQGVTPQWYVITVVPGMEGEATEALVRRRFGVYDPMFDEAYICRGRSRTKRSRVFPGMLLLFTWDVDFHWKRIRSCEGVTGMLRLAGTDEPFVVPQAFVDALYREEIIKAFALLKPPKSKRKKRRYAQRLTPGTIETKSYWDKPAMDIAAEERIGLLKKALSLAS
jgi:hypothetical protein